MEELPQDDSFRLDIDPATWEREQRQRLERNELLADMRAVLSTPAGKRLFCDILVLCDWRRSCFTGNSKTHYFEGRQDVGKVIWAIIEEASKALAVEVYRLMLEENHHAVFKDVTEI
jgi:hypothetical protein